MLIIDYSLIVSDSDHCPKCLYSDTLILCWFFLCAGFSAELRCRRISREILSWNSRPSWRKRSSLCGRISSNDCTVNRASWVMFSGYNNNNINNTGFCCEDTRPPNVCFDGMSIRRWQPLCVVPQFLAGRWWHLVDPLKHKQSFWDKPGIVYACDLVEAIYSDPQQRALDCWLQHLLTVVTCVTHHSVLSSAIWWGRPGGCSSPSRMQRMRTTFL